MVPTDVVNVDHKALFVAHHDVIRSFVDRPVEVHQHESSPIHHRD
jgi:hypothetical protein